MPKKRIDISVENHGSVMLFRVLTKKAQAWVTKNVALESWQWLGNGFAVEPRYAVDLAEGMIADGLSVH